MQLPPTRKRSLHEQSCSGVPSNMLQRLLPLTADIVNSLATVMLSNTEATFQKLEKTMISRNNAVFSSSVESTMYCRNQVWFFSLLAALNIASVAKAMLKIFALLTTKIPAPFWTLHSWLDIRLPWFLTLSIWVSTLHRTVHFCSALTQTPEMLLAASLFPNRSIPLSLDKSTAGWFDRYSW